MQIRELQIQAREAERLSQWREAESLHRKAGNQEDATICASIAEAGEIGDIYRARVRAEAGAQPDRKADPEAWKKWYSKMSAIYNEMFRSK